MGHGVTDIAGPATLVVGWDGSDQARDALELGRLIAAQTGARLLLVSVAVVHGQPLLPRNATAAIEEAEERLGSAPSGQLGRVAVDARVTQSTSVAGGLLQAARDSDALLIVIGSTHRGAIGRTMHGSVAEHLLPAATCPVAAAPRGYARRYGVRLLEVVAVAFDATAESERAVRTAAWLTTAAGAQLRVLAVLEPPPPAAPGALTLAYPPLVADEQGRMRAAVDELLERLPAAARAEASIRTGWAPSTLVAESEKGMDVLVIGSHAHGRLGRTLLGSVSSKLLREAHCPVVAVPPLARSQAERIGIAAAAAAILPGS